MSALKIFIIGCVFTIGGAVPIGAMTGFVGVVFVSLVIIGMLMVCIGAEEWKPGVSDDGHSDL